MAAPIASQVLGELLPALEISPDKTDEVATNKEVTVPEIRNITINEAIEKLKAIGLDYNINYEGDINKEAIIKEQLPKPGLSINSGVKVEIYVE